MVPSNVNSVFILFGSFVTLVGNNNDKLSLILGDES